MNDKQLAKKKIIFNQFRYSSRLKKQISERQQTLFLATDYRPNGGALQKAVE